MEPGVVGLDRWREAIVESFSSFAEQIATYLPLLLSGLGILFIGWLVALALAASTRRLLGGLDFLVQRFARTDSAFDIRIRSSYASVTAKIVFWVTLLFFFTVAVNMLGLELFSRWLDSIVAYIPGLLTGLLIILAGFFVANIARTGIQSAMLRAGISQSSAMARSAQVIILFSAVIIGVEQIGLDVDFLSSLIVVVSGTLLAGASLAFALGARDMVANLLGAQYSRKHCRIGETMKIGELEGEIVEITQSSIVLDTGSERAVIPGKLFHEQVSRYSNTQVEDDGSDQ